MALMVWRKTPARWSRRTRWPAPVRLGCHWPTAWTATTPWDFLTPLGDLFTTGPTHTNVNDFRALLVL